MIRKIDNTATVDRRSGPCSGCPHTERVADQIDEVGDRLSAKIMRKISAELNYRVIVRQSSHSRQLTESSTAICV